MDERDCLLQMKTANTANIASFPGSPLTLMKNKNKVGEPGTPSIYTCSLYLVPVTELVSTNLSRLAC